MTKFAVSVGRPGDAGTWFHETRLMEFSTHDGALAFAAALDRLLGVDPMTGTNEMGVAALVDELPSAPPSAR